MAENTTTILDAEGKRLGRVATQAAVFLMGKNLPSFQKNEVASQKIRIVNASRLNISPVKMLQKTYKHYSGHPGGLKIERMEEVVAKKGHSELLLQAVRRMLPRNHLRSKRMKNLSIEE